MTDRPIILIVDDVGINRTLLGKFFAGRYDCVEAASGEKALSILRSRCDISLVLLDAVMRGKSGFDVLREMKTEPALSRIPVVVMVAAGDEESELKALELGADDFVTKPCNKQLVCMRVLNVLSKSFILGENFAEGLEESNRLLRYNARHDGVSRLFNRQTFFFETEKMLS